MDYKITFDSKIGIQIYGHCADMGSIADILAIRTMSIISSNQSGV
jgi:hypothetical protein